MAISAADRGEIRREIASALDHHVNTPATIGGLRKLGTGSQDAAEGFSVLPVARGGTGLAAYATGDIVYASAANALARLAGNTVTSRRFLQQTGTGTASAAPSWTALQAADMPSAVPVVDDTFAGTASTADATPATCATYAVPDLATVVLAVTVGAHRDDHAQAAGYSLVATFRRSGGTVTQVGTTAVLAAAEDNATWDATMDVSGTSVRVRVAGVAGANLNWRARGTVVSVT